MNVYSTLAVLKIALRPDKQDVGQDRPVWAAKVYLSKLCAYVGLLCVQINLNCKFCTDCVPATLPISIFAGYPCGVLLDSVF